MTLKRVQQMAALPIPNLYSAIVRGGKDAVVVRYYCIDHISMAHKAAEEFAALPIPHIYSTAPGRTKYDPSIATDGDIVGSSNQQCSYQSPTSRLQRWRDWKQTGLRARCKSL